MFKYKLKKILPIFFIIVGTVLIIYYLPLWIWMTALGVLFIIIGFDYYNSK